MRPHLATGQHPARRLLQQEGGANDLKARGSSATHTHRTHTFGGALL